jgi:hypothetical protein
VILFFSSVAVGSVLVLASPLSCLTSGSFGGWTGELDDAFSFFVVSFGEFPMMDNLNDDFVWVVFVEAERPQ